MLTSLPNRPSCNSEHKCITTRLRKGFSIEVFGIEVEEIEVGKSKGYILVDGAKTEEEDQLIDWGDDLPKMGLLMVVLSLIFMSDHVITESLLWHTLKKLGIEPKVEHKVFGDPEKLKSQEFVRQCYVDRKKVLGGDEAAYEYRWGSRAEKELTKRQVLQFVSELYDTQMDDWASQMKEIIAEEEKAINGKPAFLKKINSYTEASQPALSEQMKKDTVFPWIRHLGPCC
ncbi:Melanoma-associated antigen G1 [Desmophyllum pertusum]|uniref:Melanoma-associated antigen G1 n=1 Tax=Desmophyllum pertusum TaxID=174260 RepID=A0A9W9YDI1_9CNID|nr:Melanoma-associated antigen G1 [Desmophyllum pertusum]